MEDYHIHTNFLDGLDTTEQITQKAQDFSIFSITDHNSIEACKKINAPNFISGIEFSIFAYNRELHLLCYGFDYQNNSLKQILSEYQYYNNQIFCNIFKNAIEKNSLEIDFHEIEKLIGANITLNKVNIANILFKNNIVKNINDAYNRYIERRYFNKHKKL